MTTVNVKASSSLEKMKLKTHMDSINSDMQKLLIHAGECAYEIWLSEEREFIALEEILQSI